ncbi:hypothetical protein DFJ77DRAFT_484485 [Powellomyces hirtus]|nr:hypothetical protein DFJ77DRAFT_484485 [Powellomyces hirtus]
MSYQSTPSTAPVRKIKRVQFGILSPEQIVAHSTAKIEHAEVYERGQPKSGGLADVRMGCIEKNMKCYTRSENMNNCQREILTAAEARSILERISDETCHLIGLDPVAARPEWMIITVLPVPPPCVRPSVNVESGGRGEDDLTAVLSNIIKYNNYLRRKEPRVAGVPQTFQRGGRLNNSVAARLKGKTGRLRGNLMGKRVDFSARTVITGDQYLSIEGVGRVTDLNLAKMQTLVDNCQTYPGANWFVKGKTNQRIDLRSARTKPQLEVGDQVERHMIDGDLILFNRQPSLHKMSMMAHRGRFMPYSTFRMNINACQSYNGDFDGDEMNLHMPQTYEARAEMEALMTVSRLLVSSQASKPVNALVQDGLYGVRKEVMDLLLQVKNWDGTLPPPTILRPMPLWTGKQLITLPEIDMTGFHWTHPDDEETPMSSGDIRVIIKAGVHLAGIISKRTIGTSSGGLIYVIFNDHGPSAGRDFLDNVALIINQWLMYQGFSTYSEVVNIVYEQYAEANELLTSFQNGTFEAQGNLSVDETKERQLQQILAQVRDASGKLNNVKQMVEAGSKACVGQQIVEGKRIARTFGDRTLPHFTKHEDTPESRGFVRNSFIRGLNPQEVWFPAMGGREETCYIQRRLYDGTVRNSRGDVIQVYYGEDGFDGIAIENQTFEIMLSSDAIFRDRYYSEAVPDEFDELTEARAFLRKQLRQPEDCWPMPLNLKRIILAAQLPIDERFIYEQVTGLRRKIRPSTLKVVDTDGSQYNSTRLFNILLLSSFSSKQVLRRHKLDRNGFLWALQQVETKFNRGLVAAAESVGVVAAQSIGKTVNILSCDEDGKVTWRAVEAVTKQPVVNRDGTNTLLKVTTQSGRFVVATKAISFLKRVNNKIVPVDGADLKVGDHLPVSKIVPTDFTTVECLDVCHYLPATLSGLPEQINLDRDFGWMCGAYLATVVAPTATLSQRRFAHIAPH